MKLLDNGCAVGWCSRCVAQTTYEFTDSGSAFGSHGWYASDRHTPEAPDFVLYRLHRCSGCRRGVVVEFRSSKEHMSEAAIAEVSPFSAETLPLPADTPEGVLNEFREAEKCANATAFRAGSAMLRSALEKTLTANGYKEGSLYAKIEAAASDGLITAARRERAHNDVRVQGNEVVHDDWKEVDQEAFTIAYVYTHRIIEDFYENRAEVERVLTECDRISK